MYSAFAQKNLETLMKSRNEFTTTEEYNEYLRIYFAGLAMQGLLANCNGGMTSGGNRIFSPNGISELAVLHADELLKQLEEK